MTIWVNLVYACLCDLASDRMTFDCLTTKSEFSSEKRPDSTWYCCFLIHICIFTNHSKLSGLQSEIDTWIVWLDLDKIFEDSPEPVEKKAPTPTSQLLDMFLQPSKSSKTKQQPYCLESHFDAKRWARVIRNRGISRSGYFHRMGTVCWKISCPKPKHAEICRSKISWSFQRLSISLVHLSEFYAGVEQMDRLRNRRPMKIPGEIQSKISARNEGPGR